MAHEKDERDIARLHLTMQEHRATPTDVTGFRLSLDSCDATWALVGHDVRWHEGRDVQPLNFGRGRKPRVRA